MIMPSYGNPKKTYRRSDELHELDRQAAAYFGEYISDPIIKALDARIRKYQRAIEEEKKGNE
jgi:hypothetical protein